MATTYLLHLLETCEHSLPYYGGQMLDLVDQFPNPLATLLIVPKPDDKIL